MVIWFFWVRRGDGGSTFSADADPTPTKREIKKECFTEARQLFGDLIATCASAKQLQKWRSTRAGFRQQPHQAPQRG
jgi:hypothetical protein